MAGVQSIERAFAILRTLALQPAGVTELAARTGLPKSTVARLLSALEAEQAVEQVEAGGGYRLGAGIEDMTYSLKSLMWRQMGILRDATNLSDALDKIVFWTRAVRELAGFERRSVELSNMLTLAQLATRGALARTESRGVHGRRDHPDTAPEWRAHTVFRPILDEAEVSLVRLERAPVPEPVPSS